MGVVVYRTQEVFKMHELRQKNLEFLLHSEALKVVCGVIFYMMSNLSVRSCDNMYISIIKWMHLNIYVSSVHFPPDVRYCDSFRM